MKKRSDVDLIIFDLDGTALNTDLYVIMNHLHLREKYYKKADLDLETMLSFSGPTLDDTYHKYYADIDYETFMKDFSKFSLEKSNYYSCLYKDEIEVLESLKTVGYKLVIFTSKRKFATKDNLSYFKLDKYFDLVVSYEDVEKPKPDASGIDLICSKFKISNRNRVYMIGDSSSDYYTAKNGNIKSILVTWGNRKYKADCLPDKYVSSYNEIAKEFILE